MCCQGILFKITVMDTDMRVNDLIDQITLNFTTIGLEPERRNVSHPRGNGLANTA